MNDAPPGGSAGKAPVHGIACLGFVRDGARSRLGPLYQQPPLRVLFPRPAAGDPIQAVLVNTSGGVVGGDRLEVSVRLEGGTRALVTSQAAEKVYRSAGPVARIDVRLSIGGGAWLEWCPQETILFDQARLRRHLVIDAEPDGRALVGEVLVFGRAAHGERLGTGLLHDHWAVRVDGHLRWADALRLDGDIAGKLAAPFGFAGARAAATLIYLGQDAERWLTSARALRGVGLTAAKGQVTCILGRNGVGKTSLLRAILGLAPIRHGSIVWEGQDLGPMPAHQRARAGLANVPQGREIFPRLTVEENLRTGFAARPRGERRIPDKIYELFPVLKDMARRRGGDLSGGQQQQLAIGRALITRPRLLLLDEPTEGIQPSIVKLIAGVIGQLAARGDMAIVVVERHLEFARQIADRLVVIERGAVVLAGARDDLDDTRVRQHLTV